MRIVYFAGARDAAGKQSELIDAGGKPTVADVLDQLAELHPGLKAMKRSIRISVNHEVAEPGDRVRDGDEVGVLPPVAGG